MDAKKSDGFLVEISGALDAAHYAHRPTPISREEFARLERFAGPYSHYYFYEDLPAATRAYEGANQE